MPNSSPESRQETGPLPAQHSSTRKYVAGWWLVIEITVVACLLIVWQCYELTQVSSDHLVPVDGFDRAGVMVQIGPLQLKPNEPARITLATIGSSDQPGVDLITLPLSVYNEHRTQAKDVTVIVPLVETVPLSEEAIEAIQASDLFHTDWDRPEYVRIGGKLYMILHKPAVGPRQSLKTYVSVPVERPSGMTLGSPPASSPSASTPDLHFNAAVLVEGDALQSFAVRIELQSATKADTWSKGIEAGLHRNVRDRYQKVSFLMMPFTVLSETATYGYGFPLVLLNDPIEIRQWEFVTTNIRQHNVSTGITPFGVFIVFVLPILLLGLLTCGLRAMVVRFRQSRRTSSLNS